MPSRQPGSARDSRMVSPSPLRTMESASCRLTQCLGIQIMCPKRMPGGLGVERMEWAAHRYHELASLPPPAPASLEGLEKGPLPGCPLPGS